MQTLRTPSPSGASLMSGDAEQYGSPIDATTASTTPPTRRPEPTGRLLVVSNRLPVTVAAHGAAVAITPSVGGLATGLRGAHERTHDVSCWAQDFLSCWAQDFLAGLSAAS